MEPVRGLESAPLTADDLLGCDCGGKGDGVSAADEEDQTPPVDDEDDNSGDEASAGFISATQFDPEPVS